MLKIKFIGKRVKDLKNMKKLIRIKYNTSNKYY